MKKKKTPIIFINASVILAGVKSPTGGSAKILDWAKKGTVNGLISEIVLDEVLRHSNKIKKNPTTLKRTLGKIVKILEAPKKEIRKYEKIVKDVGDVHLFTSSELANVDYLISLDKKHVLSLSKRIKKFKIMSPGEFIQSMKH